MIAQTIELEKRTMNKQEGLTIKKLDEVVLTPIKIMDEKISPIYQLDEARLRKIRKNLVDCVLKKKPCKGLVERYICRDKDSEVLKKSRLLIDEFINSLTEKVKPEETKEFFDNTYFTYNLNSRYPILGTEKQIDLTSEFFYHITKEFTQNAFDNYFRLLNKKTELLSAVEVSAIPIDAFNYEEAVPLLLNGSTEQFNTIDNILNNYKVEFKTSQNKDYCKISCKNPAILDEAEENRLIKTINNAFLYKAKNSSETTQSVKTTRESTSIWGGLGFITVCTLLKAVDGDISFFYSPQFNTFELTAQVPLKNLPRIPSLMKNYSSN